MPYFFRYGASRFSFSPKHPKIINQNKEKVKNRKLEIHWEENPQYSFAANLQRGANIFQFQVCTVVHSLKQIANRPMEIVEEKIQILSRRN